MFFFRKKYYYVAVIGYFTDNVLTRTEVFSNPIRAHKWEVGAEVKRDVKSVCAGIKSTRLLSVSIY